MIRTMWISEGEDELLGETAEPAPAGWTDDPRQMKKRARDLAQAGNYQAALEILEPLYEQGLRYPVPLNIAVCYARLGDLATAARWLVEGIDDPAFKWPQPYPYDDSSGRAGFLEAYYHWSRNQPYAP